MQTLPLGLCLLGASVLAAACGAAPAEKEQARLPGQAFSPGTSSAEIDTDALPPRFGFGRAATTVEIATLDIDVMSDGAGLPLGRGTVPDGAAVYAAQCASCHGGQGEGVPGVGNRLVGTEPIDSTGWNRTIGNYWPHATTVFDYIRRAMPYDRPGTLSDEQAYALTAYLLHLNGIVPAGAVMDAATLPRVAMPASDLMVPDDRLSGAWVR
jgi:S-disulfanyl-L-cysteine oxidoreductase SoxD